MYHIVSRFHEVLHPHFMEFQRTICMLKISIPRKVLNGVDARHHFPAYCEGETKGECEKANHEGPKRCVCEPFASSQL